MSGTPTQLKKIAELLAQPANSADDLARTLWDTVETLQGSRDRYILVAYHPTHNVLEAVGPYPTDRQARKDVSERIVQTGGTQVRVARLKAPESIDNGPGRLL
jgi:hypothetical protein